MKVNKFFFTILLIIMAFALVANYMSNFTFNITGKYNRSFENFQEDSESLVTGPLYAEKFGIEGLNGYGLGRFSSSLGVYYSNTMKAKDNAYWEKGYSQKEPAIIISSNECTKNLIKDLKKIQFEKGSIFYVTNTIKENKYFIIKLDSKDILTYNDSGNIENITFINEERERNKALCLNEYRSQFGLQGKIFKKLSNFISPDINYNIKILHVLCSIAAAIVFIIIVVLIFIKYGLLMATIFYLTFLLSPWIVNFARNLYWVEFTWFMPMAVGLFCSLKINYYKYRIFCYIAAFFTILIKCLCGYEYISTIMLSLVMFLIIDFILSILNRDRNNSVLIGKIILIFSIIALLGFIVSLCIHAPLKSNGDIVEGLKKIYFDDVLRRTIGGDNLNFAPEYSKSFEVSVLEVIMTYLKFDSSILTGIPSSMFPILSGVPLLIFIYDYIQAIKY